MTKKSQYLNETILPPVLNLLTSALKVLPRNSKIIAKPEVCEDKVKIPAYASETGYDSDLVLFVKIIDQTWGWSTDFVQVETCAHDETTHRFEDLLLTILTPFLDPLSGL